MKKRTPIKWRDKDGDVWNQHDDPRFLWDADIQYRRDTVEKQWGPLTPIEWERPDNLWGRMTATWQGRLSVTATTFILLVCLVTGFAAIARGEDPTWYFLGPILVIATFTAVVTAFIRIIMWIWPDL